MRPAHALLVLATTLGVGKAAAQDASCDAALADGQRELKLHRLLEARDHFGRCAQVSCNDPQMLEVCQGLRAKVDAALPSVVVIVKSGEEDVGDATIWIDGQRASDRVDGRAVPVNPGSHTIRVAARGREPVEKVVVVGEGEQRRKIELRLPEVRAPEGREAIVASVVLGATALAGWGVFAGLAAWGKSGEGDLVVAGSTDAEVDAVQSRYVAADVALWVSAGLTLGSVIAVSVGAAQNAGSASRSPKTEVAAGPLGLRLRTEF